MKKSKLLVLGAMSLLVLAGCDGKTSSVTSSSSDQQPVSSSTPSVETVVLELSCPNPTIDLDKGETSVTVTATVTGTSNTAVTWSANSVLVTVADGVVTLAAGASVKLDTSVSVTATSVADPSVSKAITIMIKPVFNIGNVDKLTSDMIKAISDESVTVSGTLTDVSTDLERQETTKTVYNMKTYMAKDAWMGTYWIDGQDVQEVNYRKGTTDGYIDEDGNSGHALTQYYVDKNNEIIAEEIENTWGYKSLWEQQHLWNHLGQLDINKFEYDRDEAAYSYKIDTKSATDLWLMTYLSYCLTPLLDETLMEFYLTVNDTEITGIRARTAVAYYPDDAETPSSAFYSEIELTLSDIGTTVVKDPTKYEADENTPVLKAALDKIKAAGNYTYKVTDTTTSAPSVDDGEYGAKRAVSTGINRKVAENGNYSTGTVGQVGWITKDAALYEDTFKYSYGLDDKLYRVTYSGLKQNADNTYEEFEYDSTVKHMVGKKKKTGNIADALPGFDFAPEIFEFKSSTTSGGKTVYNFGLRDSAITWQVAPEVSNYKYATSASSSVARTMTLTVDSNGNLISSSFPYDLTSGTYQGYCNTSYSAIGTTDLATEFPTLFNNYSPKVYQTSWAEYEVDYHHNGSTLNTTKVPVSEILTEMYGEKASSFPTPDDFRSVFGDDINGPWHDMKNIGTADAPEYHSVLSINTSSTDLDRNNRIKNFDELMEQMLTVLTPKGYQTMVSNTDTSNQNRRFYTLLNDAANIMIVFENQGFKTIYINCYIGGDWKLSK